jgi:predicted Zn-dependent protease
MTLERPGKDSGHGLLRNVESVQGALSLLKENLHNIKNLSKNKANVEFQAHWAASELHESWGNGTEGQTLSPNCFTDRFPLSHR